MKLKIYSQSGELKLTASTSPSSTWNRELMTENVVSVSFTHPFYVPLDVNDYVMLEGVKFSIKKVYKPKQKDTQAYSYSVKFYAPIHDAEQVMYLHLADGAYEPKFSLDGGPREHLRKWVDNMNRIYGNEVWSIGEVVEAGYKTIEYNNVTCWDAATLIAEAFGTEWWTDGFTFNLSRCEHGELVELGYMRGLTSLVQSENSDSVKFFTRLIPLGSTRNIDPSRYGFSRLQLPDRAKYVDRNTDYGLYEYVEEDAFAEIFPHYTGSITSVRSEEKTGEDGNKFTVYYFKDSGMAFDPCKNEIAGLVKHVSFQTGDLDGRDFEANYDPETEEWEIINTYPDEETQIPGGNLVPAVGDQYTPWNFRMPVEYETQAELDYKVAVDDYLARYSDDISKYGGDTDYIYIDKYAIPLTPGQRVRLLSEQYFSASDGYKDTRMTKVVRKLDNLSIATIECTNEVGKGWRKQVESGLSELKYVIDEKTAQMFIEVLKTWDIKEPGNYNVFSALRSKAEFLSKKYPDETRALIKFLGGLEIGEAIDSLTAGKGIIADDNGRMQLSRLEVRQSMTVMELIINRLQGIMSDYSFADTGMIEQVDDLGYRTYRLALRKSTEFDFHSFEPDDVCFSIVNNLMLGGTDYYTSWMRAVSKNMNGNTLTVVLYPDNEVPGGRNYPPVAGYNLTRRGNARVPADGEPDNPRAQSWMLSSGEGRLMFLANVFKPMLDDYNYALTIGRLPSIKALEKLPVGRDDVGVVAKTLIAESFWQFDYNGDVIPRRVPRGAWSLEVAQGEKPYRFLSHETAEPDGSTVTVLEQHTVTHYGCTWACLADKTTDEPKWNSAAWSLLEGDPNYRMEFSSTRGWMFRRTGWETDITASVLHANRDITAEVMADAGTEVEWLRDTGNPADDNAWHPVHAAGGRHTLHLTPYDLGAGWCIDYMEVTFTCRIFVPMGGELQKVENRVAFKT